MPEGGAIDGVRGDPGNDGLPLVIPGHREAMSPESITTTGSIDSGPAPSGASRNDESYNGKLSCFFIGISTCLSRSIASARAILRLVECGMMTSSI
jgi:hypothetical protein